MTEILDILACPSCGELLHREGNSLKCQQNHTFDIAKCGYANLLPPGKEKNSRTGDEKVMVKARADFLSLGYYDKISTHIAEIISDNIQNNGKTLITADMGSGEGHHTLNYTQKLAEKGYRVLSVGFDASKYAAEYGMKKSRAARLSSRDGIGGNDETPSALYFVPANIFSIPLISRSIDVCVSMFAPIPWDETARLLNCSDSERDSLLIVVSSGKNHLIEMRSLIYDNVILSDSLPSADIRFNAIYQTNLTYNIHLKSTEDIKNLFMMTPFYYKTTEEGRNRLYSKSELDVTADVNYTVFKLVK